MKRELTFNEANADIPSAPVRDRGVADVGGRSVGNIRFVPASCSPVTTGIFFKSMRTALQRRTHRACALHTKLVHERPQAVIPTA
jgi:hypothetical protein